MTTYLVCRNGDCAQTHEKKEFNIVRGMDLDTVRCKKCNTRLPDKEGNVLLSANARVVRTFDTEAAKQAIIKEIEEIEEKEKEMKKRKKGLKEQLKDF